MSIEQLQDSLASCSDDELIEAINLGRVEEGLAVLQERYGRRIRKFAASIVRDYSMAQDVAQETFIKVFFRSHLYQIGTNFKAWMFEIARNQALSALRSRRRNPRPLSSLTHLDSDSEFEFFDHLLGQADDRRPESAEFQHAFEQAVQNLPEHYRTVFDICVVQGRPYQEVAEELGLPCGTVAIRIMRARKILFKGLSHHLGRLRRPPACIQ